MISHNFINDVCYCSGVNIQKEMKNPVSFFPLSQPVVLAENWLTE